MTKKYKVNNEFYEIPDIKVSDFISSFPEAIEVQDFDVDGEMYSIPVDKVDAFTIDKPQAIPVKKKEPSVNDFLPTSENFQKKQEEQLTSAKPVAFEETLPETTTVSSAIKAANNKSIYKGQQVSSYQDNTLKEIEDFASKLDADYTKKAQKEGADSSALKEERYWKEQQFLASKQSELEKYVDDLYKPDKYDYLGDGDVKILTKQIDYIMGQPMIFEEREKAINTVKDKFIAQLANLPEEYRKPIEGEVNELFSKKTLFDEEGQITMHGWKKEATELLNKVRVSEEKIHGDFYSKYPDFVEVFSTQPGGTSSSYPTRTKGEMDQQFFRDYNQYKRDMALLAVSEDKVGRVMEFPDNGSNIATPFKEGGRDLLLAIASAGYSDIAKAIEEGTIASKVQKGDELSVGERAAFDAKGIFDAAQEKIPQSAGRKLGNVIAQGIPFIEQMAMLGGVGVKIGESTLKEILKKEGVKALSGRGLALTGKTLAKGMGTAFAISPLMPMTWQRQQSGLAGLQTLDNEGNWTVDPTTVEGWWEATIKGIATGATETFSEMAGGYIGEFGGVFNKIAKVTGSSMRMPSGIAAAMKAAKIQGTPTEILEELINIPLQAPIGDQPLPNLKKGEGGWQTLWDTIWTTAAFTTILGSGAIVGSPWAAIKRNRNYNVVNIFGRDNVAAVRDAILNGDKEAWSNAMINAVDNFDQAKTDMEIGPALDQLAEYSKSLAIEAVARSERLIKTEDKDQDMLAPAEETAVAGEQKPISKENRKEPSPINLDENKAVAIEPKAEVVETEGQITKELGGTKNAESIRVEVEKAGQQAQGLVEGEEERLRLRNNEENRVEAQPGEEVKVVRTDDGSVAYMVAEETTPSPEIKEQARAEIQRLNALSKGQKVIIVGEGEAAYNKAAAKEFEDRKGILGLHFKGDKVSYINIDRATSVEQVRRTWIHEAAIHGGIERMFGTKEEYLSNVLGVVKNLGGRKAALDKIAELGGSRALYVSQTDAMLGEEYLAFLSRKIITDPNLSVEKVLDTEQLSAWKRFVKMIKDAIAKQFGVAIDLTDADIANLIIDASKVAMSEAGAKKETVFKGRGNSVGEMMAESVTIGNGNTTKIAVAPYYDTKVSTIEEARKLRDSDTYKQYKQHIYDIADVLGIKVKNISDNIGGYLNDKTGDKIIEISNTVEIDGTIEQAEELAAFLRALAVEGQEEAYANKYVEPGSAGHNIDEVIVKVSDINKAIEALKVSKNYGFTINETDNTISFFDFSKGEDVGFDNKIGIFVTELINRNVEYEEQGKRAVESRPVNEGRSSEIFEKIKNDAIRYEQGGTVLRDLIAEAERRDTEFRRKTGREVQKIADKATVPSKPLESDFTKRLKSHIRKMVLAAHGVKAAKVTDKAYDIGVAEEKLIRDIEEGKGKAEKKRAAETYRQISKFISKALKTAPFGTKLSRMQTRMIVNEARRVSDLDSLQNFFMVLDRIVDNTQYAKEMASARKMQKNIRQRVSGGYYGKEAQKVLDFATLPLRVRDFSMEALQKYNAVATALLAGRVPTEGIVALRTYAPPEISEAKEVGVRKAINSITDEDSFTEVMDKIEAIPINTPADYNRVLGYINAVRDRLAETKLDEETTTGLEDRLDEYETALDERAAVIDEELEQEKLNTIAESKDMREEVDKEDFYDKEWLEVKKFMDITPAELMKMSPKQVMLYRNIMEGLTEEFVNKQLYEFINETDKQSILTAWQAIEAQIQGGYARIREMGDKLASFFLTKPLATWIDPLRKNVDRLSNILSTNKKNLIDEKVLGIYTKNVKPLYETFYARIYRAATAMEKDVIVSMNKYWTAAQRVKKKERDKLSILLSEMDYRAGTIILEDGQEYTWDTLPPEEKRDLSRWIIDERNKMVRYDTEVLEAYRKEFVLDKDGNIDIEASLAKMFKDRNVENLYNVIREVIVENKGKARVATEMRGDFFEDVGDKYFPRYVDDAGIFGGKTGDYEIKKLQDIISPYRTVRKRAKSTYKRTHTRNAVRYDLDGIMGFYVNDVNRDYHLSRTLSAINASLKRAENLAKAGKMKDAEQLASALRKNIEDTVKIELTERLGYTALRKMMSWRRTLALAMPTRPPIEFTSNALRYFLMDPQAALQSSTDQRWKKVFDMVNSPIALKQQVSKWNTETMGDVKRTWYEKGAEFLYTAADTLAGRLVYSGEFAKVFKETTGKKFDLDKFIGDEQYRVDNKEAISHADAMAMSMIERMYNTQSWATSPSKHKYIPFMGDERVLVSKKSFIAQTLGYMQSFNFSETAETMNAILAATRPGASPAMKAQAMWRLGNFMITNYIYMSLSGAVYVAMGAALDDEDEVKDALANYFSLKNQWKIFAGSAATLGMGRYGNLVRPVLGIVLGAGAYNKAESDTFEFIKSASSQTLNVRPIDPKERVTFIQALDRLGTIWTDIASDLLEQGTNVIDFINKVQKEGVDSLSMQEKETWLAISFVNQAIALAAPNFMSPTVERMIKAKLRGMKPAYVVQPDKQNRTYNGVDIMEVYNIEGVLGINRNEISLWSVGETETHGSPRVLSGKQMSDYQIRARERFNDYMSKYVKDNAARTAADATDESVARENSEQIKTEINALWTEAKSNTRLEMFEYEDFHMSKTFQTAARLDAIPDPIKTITRKEVNLLKNPVLAKKFNKTFMKTYLELYKQAYPTEGDVKRARKALDDKGVSQFATWQAEAIKEARDAAVEAHIDN
jgi:hypothetical protein